MERKPLSLECDNCGAKVPAQTAYGTYTCEYCGHRFHLEPPRTANRTVAPPMHHVQAQVNRAQAQARKAAVIISVAVFLMVAIGGVVAWLVTSSAVTSVTSAVGGIKISSGGGGLFSKGERVLWDNVGGPPTAVTIDGKEHVIGRIRDLNKDGQLSIRIYESSTLAQRWRSPDLGTYSQAYKGVRYVVVGERLLVSDGRNTLHVYELGAGKELGTHALTDRVEQLCPMPEGTKVWVQVVDRQNILFDVQGLATEEARRRPAHCPRHARFGPELSRRRPEGKYPKVEGLEPKRLLVDGDAGVVYGAKSPGTPIPTAAGFVPGTSQVRWTRPVVQVDPTSYRPSFERFFADLAGGRFVTVYGVGTKGWHVGALDARTGDPLWDVSLRTIMAVDTINGFDLTGSFVYVVRTSSLDVLSAKDGKLIGSVGFELYQG